MSWKTVLLAWLAGASVVGGLAAQDPGTADSVSHAGHRAHQGQASSDSGFAALQQRGGQVMGVDQYQSAHRFDALPDGGRIELQSRTGDTADVAQIRGHFREIREAFMAGDFSKPFEVHAGFVPGNTLMTERRDRIRYTLHDLPRGAELRLSSADPEVVRAIHDFLAFQRGDHRAPGKE